MVDDDGEHGLLYNPSGGTLQEQAMKCIKAKLAVHTNGMCIRELNIKQWNRTELRWPSH